MIGPWVWLEVTVNHKRCQHFIHDWINNILHKFSYQLFCTWSWNVFHYESPTKQISPNCTCMLTKKATETKGVEACSLWTISECINCKTPQNPTWWFPLRLPYAECPQRKYHKYLPTPALRMTMWGKTRMSFWRLQVYWQHKRLKDRRIWTKR
jgi:hypothetical protein